MQGVPFNETFENSLIVGLLRDPSLLPQVTEIISYEDFYKFSNKEIFKVISNTPVDDIDSLTIQDKLSKDATTHFESLVRDGDSILPSLSNILVYAEEIKSKSILRECVQIGGEIASLGYRDGVTAEEAYAELEAKFANFLHKRSQDYKGESTQEAFEKFIEGLGERVNREGIRSGFYAIDLVLQKLEGLIILAARPSMGKTAMAINLARNVANVKPVLFFSLEQSQEQVFERLLASEAAVDLEEIRSGAFIADPDAVDRIKGVRPLMSQVMSRIHVDQRPGLTAAQVASTARQKKIEWGEIGLILVDYLHIMTLNDKMKVDALGDAVRDLRGLGKELGAPVILLSQLSRQLENSPTTNEDNKRVKRRPELPDLRGSGEIEQNADVVLFLYRESYYMGQKPDEDQVEVIIAKHRNGRTGTVMLDWFPKIQRFTDQL